MKSLRVATGQFSVEGRIEHNRPWVLKQIAQVVLRLSFGSESCMR